MIEPQNWRNEFAVEHKAYDKCVLLIQTYNFSILGMRALCSGDGGGAKQPA